MTTANQNKVADVGAARLVPYNCDVTGSNDFNQGDLLYLDTSSHTVKAVGSDGNAATLVGVASDTSWLTVYGTKTYPTSGAVEVFTAGIFTFNTTAADTYNDGDAVYIGADAQTVTSTAGGNTHKLGIVKLRPGQGAVTGAAGTTIDILIVPQYPVNAAY
jgi:predicted RecA/RadA family phage recombinase